MYVHMVLPIKGVNYINTHTHTYGELSLNGTYSCIKTWIVYTSHMHIYGQSFSWWATSQLHVHVTQGRHVIKTNYHEELVDLHRVLRNNIDLWNDHHEEIDEAILIYQLMWNFYHEHRERWKLSSIDGSLALEDHSI